MTMSGGCRCGAIRYEVDGEPRHHALCHCADCRASSGAPVMAWMAFDAAQLRVTSGEPRSFHGQGQALRQFCGDCGTGLFYHNADMLPGIVDIQPATLDPEPGQTAPAPGAQIQCAERLEWMTRLSAMPEF